MNLIIAIALPVAGFSVACRSAQPVARGAVDPDRAAQLALAAFPTVRGHLAIARRTWHRSDTALVQLAAVMPVWTAGAAPESTLVVWIAPGDRVLRSQWVIDATAASRLR